MKLKKTELLILRKVKSDMISNYGFRYPKRGWVEAPDWSEKPKCGAGLHGLEWGAGDFNIEHYGPMFQVIKVDTKDGYFRLGGKVKFRKGYVLFTTESQERAISYLKKYAPKNVVMNYDITTEKYAVSGYRSTQTAGYRSTQTAGYRSTQTAGDNSIQTAGNRSTQTAGNGSVQVGRWWYEDGTVKTAVRIITEEEAGKPYFFENGKWTKKIDKNNSD